LLKLEQRQLRFKDGNKFWCPKLSSEILQEELGALSPNYRLETQLWVISLQISRCHCHEYHFCCSIVPLRASFQILTVVKIFLMHSNRTSHRLQKPVKPKTYTPNSQHRHFRIFRSFMEHEATTYPGSHFGGANGWPVRFRKLTLFPAAFPTVGVWLSWHAFRWSSGMVSLPCR
jgi:hypothetical protein